MGVSLVTGGCPWFTGVSSVTWGVSLVWRSAVLVSLLPGREFHLAPCMLACRRSTRLASKRGSDSSSHSLESSRASAASDPGEHTDTETRVRSDALSGKYPEESLLCWSFVPNYYSLMGHCHKVYHHVPLPIHFSVLSALKERLEEFPAISTSQSEYTHTYIRTPSTPAQPTYTATQHLKGNAQALTQATVKP